MKIYNTRKDMLYEFPINGIIAELGVFKGDFSQQIIDTCKPKKIVLIDAWYMFSTIMSGDENGNNIEYHIADNLYLEVLKRFENNSIVEIERDFTNILKTYDDNYFDAIYIDADHSYEAVKKDLNNAYQKVKDGGIIAGHDYEFNLEKAHCTYPFGVKQAVDEFCIEHNLSISAKAMDGCVSFLIRVKK